MGKTLFATILANQLGKKIIFTTGGELKSEQIFIDKLIEAEGGIIFVDEANRLPKKVGFYILPLMEQFEVQGRPIKKFSVFFATTHIGDLSKDLDALIQRCERINLEPYKNEELLEIVRQYQQKQYPLNKIPDNILLEIVKSCRQTPRNAKNLVRAYVYTQDWNKVKQYNNIIKDGITLLDVRVLKYLQQSGGAGKGSIANSIRVKPQTYEFEVEPFLIYKEFIEVSNRRKLSNQGKEFLNEII
jgi:Holliday junction resolvasome RuvABC ATP-dependent DNA helicase subunit